MAGTTDFGDIDHAVLKGMVDGAKPAEVLKRAGQLQDAGRVLSELSTALQAHLGKVTWEGPAAENFKTWVGNLYKSAAIISQHATTAGSAMNQAGEALSTARSAVPKPPETEIQTINRHSSQSTLLNVPQLAVGQTVDDYMKTVNPKWVTTAEFNQAKAKVEKEHQEAILQMEKLAQAYSAATTTLNGIDDNVSLPGTPGADSNKGDSPDYPGSGGGSGGSGGVVRTPRTGGGSVGDSSRPSGGGGYGGGTVLPRDPGAGGPGPGNPGNTPPPPHGGGGQLPPAPQDPGTPSPPSYPSEPVNRPGTDLNSLPPAPTLPTQTGPYGPGGGQLPTDGPTTLPGYPGGPGGSNNGPGIPGGGPVTGIPGGTGGGTVPGKGGGSGYFSGKGGGQIQPRTSPFGGGQAQGKGGSPGLPSGTVFGAREAGPAGGRVGGPGAMGGMHPGMGGAHGGAVGAGGGSRGRGLTSTPGGTVGGRKGPTAGGEFTPGGTGLRNRAAGAGETGPQSRQNGMMAPGTAGHGSRKERDRRKRADYLHEDEETWTSGTPHSNPDVIE
ncbi:WXG100 family type VII secretion target [Kitasatospora sp. NPDC018619]|uniref:WXG100 family type VII secretion target n=1 Tax=unclassified Kitasatospora TaxID=2633591 RepID=UPI0037927632